MNRSSSTPRSALPKHIGSLFEMTKPSRDCPAPAADRIGAGRLTRWSQQMPEDDGGAAMQHRHSRCRSATQSPPSSQTIGKPASEDGIKEAAGANTEHAQAEQRCRVASADVLLLPASAQKGYGCNVSVKTSDQFTAPVEARRLKIQPRHA